MCQRQGQQKSAGSGGGQDCLRQEKQRWSQRSHSKVAAGTGGAPQGEGLQAGGLAVGSSLHC